MDYSCQTPEGMTHFRMSVIPVVFGLARAVVEHTDVTDLQHSKEEDFKRLQEFARRLIHAQEEERQRISQEVHDDLGHRIALLSFQVRQIIEQHSKNPSASIRDLHKILDGINDFSTGLRNLSHNLYPPALRYLGIKAALQSLSKEFEKAYGIQVDLVLPATVPRLPAEMELGVFRILQESLQNVAKHSGSRKVRIVLGRLNGEIRLTITDMGRGFNKSDVSKKAGLGILSMQQRALSIGACLDLNTSPRAGTEIALRVPIPEDRVVMVE
jgi:two-component system NarL family sensor kinase